VDSPDGPSLGVEVVKQLLQDSSLVFGACVADFSFKVFKVESGLWELVKWVGCLLFWGLLFFLYSWLLFLLGLFLLLGLLFFLLLSLWLLLIGSLGGFVSTDKLWNEFLLAKPKLSEVVLELL
jgi:hypothetical protein